MSSADELAKNLKRLRKDFGLSQAALAELAGLEPMSVYNYEAQIRWPRPDNLDALAKALKCEPWMLLRPGSDATEVSEEDAMRALAKHFGFRLVRT